MLNVVVVTEITQTILYESFRKNKNKKRRQFRMGKFSSKNYAFAHVDKDLSAVYFNARNPAGFSCAAILSDAVKGSYSRNQVEVVKRPRRIHATSPGLKTLSPQSLLRWQHRCCLVCRSLWHDQHAKITITVINNYKFLLIVIDVFNKYPWVND